MSLSKRSKLSRAFFASALVLLWLSLDLRPHLIPLLTTAFTSASNTDGAAPLQLPAPGDSITAELSPDETRSYQLELAANQFFHARIEPVNGDAAVTLSEAGGKVLAQFDCRRDGPTPLSVISETPARYLLEVRSLEREGVRLRYSLQVEKIRAATPNDRERISAENAFNEGERLLKEWRAEATRAAAVKFKDASAAWKLTGERSEEAHALKRLGDVHQLLGEYEDARLFYTQALALDGALGDARLEGETLNALSYVYLTIGEQQKALTLCTRALKTSRGEGSESLHVRARALNNLGEIYYGLGDAQKSLAFYRQALPLWREAGNKGEQALTLLNFGYTYSDLGQMNEALDSYNQALPLWRVARDKRGEGMTLTALGRLYSRMGESQRALDLFEQAMPLIQPTGALAEEGRILNGIAYVYDQLGEKQKAVEYYDRAFPLFRATKDYSGEAGTLYDAGRVYASLGENQKALDYFQQALAISRAARDRRLESFELRELGRVYDSLGERAKALGYYESTLSFWRNEKDYRAEADTLNPVGRIYESWGRKPEALAHYNRALLLSHKAEYPFGEAAALYNIAHAERESGNLTEARARIEAALEVIESLRTKIDSQDLRSAYFASVRQPYEFYIDLLMQLHHESPLAGFDRAAFDASERARARSLLETLANAGSSGGGDDRSGMAEAASRQTQPLKLETIQAQVVDDDTVLLEYSLGDERSYLWAVTKTAIQSYELPGRAIVESAANRVRSLLIAPQPIKGESIAEQQQRAAKSGEQYWQEAAALGKMLLEPIAAQLRAKRLLIVADGALQYIPFNALPMASGEGQGEFIPLMLDHEITIQPSASTLAALRSEMKGRSRAPKMIAVFADPVFEQDDSRLQRRDDAEAASGEAQSPTRDTEVYRALRDVGVMNGTETIPRLIASRDEAAAIMALAPAADNLQAIGFEANKTAATSDELGRYRIIHFATHGVLDNERPELSGLVLSLYDNQGRPRDGFLRLNDIYHLRLPAEMVVLSACNTGLGKEVKGEGLIGLVRAFMYAGTTRVLASLWKVDDEATAELMRHFYRQMIQEKQTPAAALRAAQITMWRQQRWRSPYFWAAFVLEGEYQGQIELSAADRRHGITATQVGASVAAVLVVLVGLYFLNRRMLSR